MRSLTASRWLWAAVLSCAALLTAYSILVPAPWGALAWFLLIPVGGCDICITRRVALGQEPLPHARDAGSILRRGVASAIIVTAYMSSLIFVILALLATILPLMFLTALVHRSSLPALLSILGPVLVVVIVAWVALSWSFLILGPYPRYALGDHLRDGFRVREMWATFLRNRRVAAPVIACELAGATFIALVQYSFWWPLHLTQGKARWAVLSHLSQARLAPVVVVLGVAVVGAVLSVALRFLVAHLSGQYASVAYEPSAGHHAVEQTRPAEDANALS